MPIKISQLKYEYVFVKFYKYNKNLNLDIFFINFNISPVFLILVIRYTLFYYYNFLFFILIVNFEGTIIMEGGKRELGECSATNIYTLELTVIYTFLMQYVILLSTINDIN